jgi:hypothetical protein
MTGAMKLSAAVCFIFLIGFSMYTNRFVYDNGQERITPDGIEYLKAAKNEPVGDPFSTRILGPTLARLINASDPVRAFHVITPISLILSLFSILWLLYPKSPVLFFTALGSGFAITIGMTYGGMPVLVDPLLLLFSSGVALCLYHQKLLQALAFICLAVLTKEYGVLLFAPWAYAAWSKKKSYLILGLLCVSALAFHHITNAAGYNAFNYSRGSLLIAQLLYYPDQISYLGLWRGLARLYYAAWLGLLPLLILIVVVALKERGISIAVFACVGLPLLVLGDWQRTTNLLYPFLAWAMAGSCFSKDKSWSLSVAGCVLISVVLMMQIPPLLRYFLMVLAAIAFCWFIIRSYRVICSMATEPSLRYVRPDKSAAK